MKFDKKIQALWGPQVFFDLLDCQTSDMVSSRSKAIHLILEKSVCICIPSFHLKFYICCNLIHIVILFLRECNGFTAKSKGRLTKIKLESM